MRAVAREHRVPVLGLGPLSCVGVYLDVVRPGLVRVGDPVVRVEDGREEDGREKDGVKEDGREEDGREEDGVKEDGREKDGRQAGRWAENE
jgi:hypothetical protein